MRLDSLKSINAIGKTPHEALSMTIEHVNKLTGIVIDLNKEIEDLKRKQSDLERQTSILESSTRR
jgi:hypothetical protein